MRDKLVFLVIGAVASVLFWIFRVELYEALYTVNGFSDQMYNTGAYGTVAVITIAMAWGMAAIYYYVINSVKFDRWYHWLAMMGVTTCSLLWCATSWWHICSKASTMAPSSSHSRFTTSCSRH